MVCAFFERDLLAVTRQRLAERGQLERNLQRSHRGGFFATLSQQVEQRQVGLYGLFGILDAGGVLTEVVDGDEAPRGTQCGNRIHRLGNGLACDEPFHDLAGHRDPLGSTTQPR